MANTFAPRCNRRDDLSGRSIHTMSGCIRNRRKEADSLRKLHSARRRKDSARNAVKTSIEAVVSNNGYRWERRHPDCLLRKCEMPKGRMPALPGSEPVIRYLWT